MAYYFSNAIPSRRRSFLVARQNARRRGAALAANTVKRNRDRQREISSIAL